MSASRLTYLILIPVLIATLVPTLAVAFPHYLASPIVLKVGLFVSLLFIMAYAVGMILLALHDHRNILAKRVFRKG